ncbi:hypothetical protein B0I35DRAFT_426312 [Stachybotrys elegans]|uniref:Uncharacterized protein n=1 Tax=Stachybotrys elegans TaxID=80388 RepID=A0A8K0SZW1_9HYPO|nr:hypothetical protein B0I35DRAFT_426312 [Stachybotrys elegans]
MLALQIGGVAELCAPDLDALPPHPGTSAAIQLLGRSGHANSAVRIAEDQVHELMAESPTPSLSTIVAAIETYIQACLDMESINSSLYSGGHLGLAKNIPELGEFLNPHQYLATIFTRSINYDILHYLCIKMPNCVRGVDLTGETLLHVHSRQVITEDSIKTFRLLLDHGVPINSQNFHGDTALHLFCRGLFKDQRINTSLEHAYTEILGLFFAHPAICIHLQNNMRDSAQDYIIIGLLAAQTQEEIDCIERLLDYFQSWDRQMYMPVDE